MKENPARYRQYALQGFLFGLIPAGIFTVFAKNPFLSGTMNAAAVFLSMILLLTGISIIFKYRKPGSALAICGILLNLFVLCFEFPRDPLLTLCCLLPALAAFYYLLTARLFPIPKTNESLQLERIIGCCTAGILLSLLAPLWSVGYKIFSPACSVNLFILLFLIWQFCSLKDYFQRPPLRIQSLLLLAGGIIALFTWLGGNVLTLFIVAPIVLLLALRYKHADLRYLELIVAHPARCLVLTFLGLCIGGTLLLRTPCAMAGELTLLEAAFTTVSAVCVTGLTVIDISGKLTVCGQFFLLILIQLGGLGIMTLTTLILHSVGKLTLSGEQLITELTQSDEQDVIDSLRLIVRITFIIELVGALLLIICFYNFHGNFVLAFRQGVFTSISAFCNAGFFPGADNLVPYAGERLLLLTVALEIILGGIAPAVIWSFCKMRRGKQLPELSRIVLKATGILVFGGTFLLLLFEWNGIFRNLPWYDKLINGFFQSVTLRTAGFNTVPFSALGTPAYIVMITLMFIGGSPGGTAGGIKTTTIAVLFFTFCAAARNEETVTVNLRRIVWQNIIQAVAVLTAAVSVLALVIMMLVTTQTIEADKLVFEAVSALATVGLSLDCTGRLDSIGCMIIMAAMFIGRIGPLTLFCVFLSERQNSFRSDYPEIKIPLS